MKRGAVRNPRVVFSLSPSFSPSFSPYAFCPHQPPLALCLASIFALTKRNRLCMPASGSDTRSVCLNYSNLRQANESAAQTASRRLPQRQSRNLRPSYSIGVFPAWPFLYRRLPRSFFFFVLLSSSLAGGIEALSRGSPCVCPFFPLRRNIVGGTRMPSVAGKQLATFITVRVLVTASNYSPVTRDI